MGKIVVDDYATEGDQGTNRVCRRAVESFNGFFFFVKRIFPSKNVRIRPPVPTRGAIAVYVCVYTRSITNKRFLRSRKNECLAIRVSSSPYSDEGKRNIQASNGVARQTSDGAVEWVNERGLGVEVWEEEGVAEGGGETGREYLNIPERL